MQRNNKIALPFITILISAFLVSCTDPEDSQNNPQNEPQDETCVDTTSTCVDDSTRQYCDDNKLQTEPCPYGCYDGKCAQCQSGNIICLDKDNIGYCYDGVYLSERCEFGCEDDECVPDPDEALTDPYDWGARNDLEWEPDIVPECEGEYGSCLYSGANCPSTYISVNSTTEKKKCVMQSTMTEEEIAGFDLNDLDHLMCIKGTVPGRYCRKVAPEALGEDSQFPVLDGQICTPEQLNPGPDTLRIHIIDVGNGDSIWIQTPDDKNILIDGGESFGMALSAGPAVVDYLDFHGFEKGSTFDGVILSHPHSDHFGGFNTIFKKGYYKLSHYIDPMELDTPEIDAKSYFSWIDIVKQQVEDANIYMPVSNFFNPGESFPEEIFGTKVNAQYLFSRSKLAKSCNTKNADCKRKDVNSTSIFFKLSYGGRSFVFAGDAGTLDEKDALAQADEYFDINFLKVCHHGSNTSSSQEYLDRIWQNTPYEERGAFISSGRRKFGETRTMRPEIVERIAPMVPPNMFLSTNAGDDNKESDKESFRDDNILVVVQENGDYYACYEGVN